MSVGQFRAVLRAELDQARFWYMVDMCRYMWSGIGKAPWVYQRLRRWVGEADVRSVPIDWPGLVQRLRDRGYDGRLPRSLRRYDRTKALGLSRMEWL